jgi:L-asparaginase II
MSFLVEQRRAGRVETVHPASAVLATPDGVTWSAGDDLATYWRSGCKPFQLVNSLENLPAGVVSALEPEDLAIGASSHSGQPRHVERVAALLTRFGLDPASLRCGAHWPMHEPSARALAAEGRTCTTLHSNCSGKHTFMLAACAARGWDPDYRPIAHPLQQGNRDGLAGWMGHVPEDGVDGCSIPTFHAPLSAMARAFARLAAAMADHDGLAGRVGWAMNAHPEYTSGDDRLDLAVVRGATRPLAVKVGAEGLFCIAIPEERAGLVVKVHTGNADALAVAVRSVLETHWPGILPGEWRWDVVKNVAGAVVGDRRVA